MRNTFKHIFAVMALAAAMALQTSAAVTTVTATADSAIIEMGSRTMLHVSVTAPADASLLPLDIPQPRSEYGGVDVVSVKADTTEMPDGRRRIDYDVLIQPFDPGMVTIPAFRFLANADTASSDIITLKVTEVDLDSLTTINPMVSVQLPEWKWYDFIPDWTVWVLVALALIGLCVALWLIYRKNGSLIIRPKVVVPPYELAMQQLNELRTEKLTETGQEKEYYTRLTDILRVYLEGRFGINAMEMTSTQILHSLRDREDTRMTAAQMKQILEIADFVKFAKVRPLPDDNIKTFNTAVDFVESTKPQPEPETEEGKDTKAETKTEK